MCFDSHIPKSVGGGGIRNTTGVNGTVAMWFFGGGQH